MSQSKTTFASAATANTANGHRPGDPKPESGTSDWNSYAKFRSRVLHKEPVAKDAYLYVVERPDGFDYRPGQAVDLSIDESGHRENKHPFTMTSLPNNPRLEFVIKSYPQSEYPEHSGMTEHLGSKVDVNDRLLFDEPWGTIQYRGPGVFIAGGTGITPFISIFRMLEQKQELAGNRLFYSCGTKADVMLQGELFRLLGRNVVCTLTDQSHEDYEHGMIDHDWLQSRVDNYDQPFYLCGPPKMVDQMKQTLTELGTPEENFVHEGMS